MVKSKNENFEVLCIPAKLSVAHTQSYLLRCLNTLSPSRFWNQCQVLIDFKEKFILDFYTHLPIHLWLQFFSPLSWQPFRSCLIVQIKQNIWKLSCQSLKRQIHKSPTIKISVPVRFNWNKSEVPFLEGREATGQFFSCGRRTLTTWSLPSACSSPGQDQ